MTGKRGGRPGSGSRRSRNLTLQIVLTLVLTFSVSAIFGLLIWNNSRRLGSSVADVWQGLLESQQEDIRTALFTENPYLSPDTAYLAKLKFWFYETYVGEKPGEEKNPPILAESEPTSQYAEVARRNIQINIRKGLQYVNGLRSVYLQLDDRAAPYVLVNGAQTLRETMLDDAWMDTCLHMQGEWYLEWRSIPLSYLHSADVISVYRRIQSENWLEEETVRGYRVMNYDAPALMSVFASILQESQKLYLYNVERADYISVGALDPSAQALGQLLDACKADAAGQDAFSYGRVQINGGQPIYYMTQELCPGIVCLICQEDVQLSSAIDRTLLTVLLLLLICTLGITVISVWNMLRYQKYNSGLHKMFAAMQTDALQLPLKENPLSAPQNEALIKRILNNEVDVSELESFVESQRELKAELEVLYGHVQINSHFLLNTLDSIYWASVNHTGADSRESLMIENLCVILKYALDSSDLFTSLRREIACAKAYIDIQKMRKDLDIRIQWDVDPDVENARMGKLVLQPVIENCVQHAVKKNKNEPLCIYISAEKDEKGRLQIRVEDNGEGMSDRRMQHFNAELKKHRYLRSRHIGLANINRRLQVQFGEENGVALTASRYGGLGVCLTMHYEEYVPLDGD